MDTLLTVLQQPEKPQCYNYNYSTCLTDELAHMDGGLFFFGISNMYVCENTDETIQTRLDIRLNFSEKYVQRGNVLNIDSIFYISIFRVRSEHHSS